MTMNKPSIEPFLRREVKEKFPWRAYVLVGLLVAFSIAFFTDKVILTGGLFVQKAHASDEINYRDVHSKYALCAFSRENPGAVINLGDNCK